MFLPSILQLSAATLLSAALIQPLAAQTTANPASDFTQLEEALRAPVERGDVPMAVAGVTDANDTVFIGAFGVRELGGNDGVNEESVFNIASMTKAVTAAAAMQLVEQGKLDLDSPISKWLPMADKLMVLEDFDAEGKPVLRKPNKPVTLRHLMTHSSGLGYVQWSDKLKRYTETQGELPPLTYDQEETWLRPLLFDPGEDWIYGESIDWIGYLVREASGQPLADYVKANITDPLDMNDTSWGLSDSMESRRVTSHQRNEKGELEATDYIADQNPPRDYGGGGLYSTVPDYLKFVRMILNEGTVDGKTILKAETVQEMAKNQMGDVRVKMIYTTDPARSEDAEFFPGVEKTWGLSFMINEEDAPTGRPAGSLAWAGLRNTFFWIDPKNKVGGVYMTQLLPFVDQKALQAFYDFETAFYKSHNADCTMTGSTK